MRPLGNGPKLTTSRTTFGKASQTAAVIFVITGSVAVCHRSQTHEPPSRVMVCMRLKPPSPIAWPCENAKLHTRRAGQTIPGRPGRLVQILIDVVQPRCSKSNDRDALLGGGCRQGKPGSILQPPQPQCFFISVPISSALRQGKRYQS
jgi:hypothetical protein